MKRKLLVALGLISLGLGAVAAAVPLLPSFPFLLLAFICFGKSSPRLQARFLSSKLYKSNLEGFISGRGMARAARIRVMVMVTLAIGLSILLLAKLPWVRVILALVWLGHMIYFLFIVKPASEE
ncbi:MAG: YbaN family protein [Eubacteriales bacterium]|nr:YbaN family protein [Eubacteriales bacterium]